MTADADHFAGTIIQGRNELELCRGIADVLPQVRQICDLDFDRALGQECNDIR